MAELYQIGVSETVPGKGAGEGDGLFPGASETVPGGKGRAVPGGLRDGAGGKGRAVPQALFCVRKAVDEGFLEEPIEEFVDSLLQPLGLDFGAVETTSSPEGVRPN